MSVALISYLYGGYLLRNPRFDYLPSSPHNPTNHIGNIGTHTRTRSESLHTNPA